MLHRRLTFLLLFFIGFYQLNAQGFWTPIDETVVPQNIVEDFHSKHPAARNTHWGMRKSGKTELYKVTAVEDHHHVKVRYDETGKELHKIHSIKESDSLPDPVKKGIENFKQQGWEVERIYYSYNADGKDKDEDHDDVLYKIFFHQENHPKKYLHVEFDKNGKIKEKDYKKHSKHEVHD